MDSNNAFELLKEEMENEEVKYKFELQKDNNKS